MKKLRPGLDLDDFFRNVAEAPSRVLLLDYDGTLAPFRAERDRAVPYPGVRTAVRELIAAGHTRLVVVSGRAVEDLQPLLGVEPPPELWGNHGWERYTPGNGLTRADPGEEATEALDRALLLARERAPSERVEVKPVSVAVHTRGLGEDDAEALLEGVREPWRALADAAGLDVHAFDGGLELRVPGRNKGTAVREILAAEPGEARVAYLGDDRTDEDAFHVLGERGDRALRVLVRDEERETAADVWIRPPDELLDFLERWHGSSRG